MKKRSICLLLALVLALSGLTACGGSDSGSSSSGSSSSSSDSGSSSSSSGETKYLTIATCPSSSGSYAFWAAHPNAISSIFPQYNISCTECTGSVSQNKTVRSGEADYGTSTTITNYESYYGTGAFEGDPDPTARTLFCFEPSIMLMAVSEESGITSLEELSGQRFTAGANGTTAETINMEIIATAGAEPDYFISAMADAIDAYSNREIIGMGKMTSTTDSNFIQLNTANPIRFLSLSEEVRDAMIEKYPYMLKYTIPAGTYEFQDYDVQTLSVMGCAVSSSRLAQEDGYNIFKALYEEGTGRDTWEAAAPSSIGFDWCEYSLQSPIPLHAGTVQYLVEQGYDVPEEIIPEEYVPVA